MTKTRQQHIDDGTFRPERHGNKAYQDALDILPEPFEDLSDYELKHYYRLGNDCIEIGTLTKSDLAALELMAIMYANYMEQCRALRVEGPFQNGKRNPRHGLKREAWQQLHPLLDKFGLTPKSKTSINKANRHPDDEEDDPLMGLNMQ